jgi:MFS family permease
VTGSTNVTTYHRLLFGLCLVVYLVGGTVSTLLAVYLPDVVTDLFGSASEERLSEVGPWLNAAFLYGMMAGGLVFGAVGDYRGRVRMLALAAALCGLFTALTARVADWSWLVAFRFVAGAGVSGILVLTTVLIAEVWPDRSRAIVQGVLSVAFPVGIVLTGGLQVLLPEWRQAFWIGLLPLAAAIAIWLLLREPATWLESRNQQAAAPLRLAFAPANRRRLLIGSVVYGAVLVGLWAIFAWMPTWLELLPGGSAARGPAMMLLGFGGMAGSAASGWLVNRFGLRSTLLLTLVGCFAASAALFIGATRFSPAVYVETALLSLFFGISQGALSVYVSELFPTAIRATASGFCFNIGRLFTATAVFFVGSLVSVLGGFGNAIFVFSGAFVVAFVALWFDRAAVMTPAEQVL